jgi:hypothetical protein
MSGVGQEFARALAEERDAADRAPALAAQHEQMNSALRSSTGYGKVVTDTDGNAVRSADGRFLTGGHGNDGGSRGGSGMTPARSAGAEMNHRLRASVGVNDGYNVETGEQA